LVSHVPAFRPADHVRRRRAEAVKSRRTRVRGWMAWPAAAALLVLLPFPAWAIESLYSRGVYPWIQEVLTLGSNAAPLAVLDVLLGLLILVAALRTVSLIRVARSRGFIAALWEGVRRLLRASAVLVVLFVLIWGAHYRR